MVCGCLHYRLFWRECKAGQAVRHGFCSCQRACFHFAVKAVENNWNAQGNLPVPSVVLYGVMVLGSVLLFLALIQKIIQQWRGKPKDAPAAGEGDDVV